MEIKESKNTSSKKYTLFICVLVSLFILSISLIVVGAINIKDVFPKEFFYTSDGFYDYYHFASFVRLIMMLGVPRQDTYSQLVTYGNVFAVQLIIYGSIILILSIACFCIKKYKDMILLALTFFVSCLTIYLLITTFLCSSLSIKSITGSNIVTFDFIYSIVIIAALILFILPHLVSRSLVIIKGNKFVTIKGFCILLLVSLILSGVLSGVLIYISLEATFVDFSPRPQDSEYLRTLSKYNNDISSQKILICPSIIYCLTACISLYTFIYLVALIVNIVKKTKHSYKSN